MESSSKDLAQGQLDAVQHSGSWHHSSKALAGQLSYSQKPWTVVELVVGIWNGPGKGGKEMPEKRASRTGNGSNRIARRKRKNKKRSEPGRIGKVGTEKGTAEQEASRSETRPGGSTRVVVEVGACKTERGAYRSLAVQGEIEEGNPAPWEPNQEARLVGGGGASGVCTAAASDS